GHLLVKRLDFKVIIANILSHLLVIGQIGRYDYLIQGYSGPLPSIFSKRSMGISTAIPVYPGLSLLYFIIELFKGIIALAPRIVFPSIGFRIARAPSLSFYSDMISGGLHYLGIYLDLWKTAP